MFREFVPAACVIANQQFSLMNIRKIRLHRENKTVTMTFHSRIAFGNQAKMVKRLCLGGPSGCLGTFLEPPGSWLGRFLRRDEDWWSFWRVPGRLRSPFWKPAGPSRDPKFAKNMHLWPERWCRGASLEVCFAIVCAICVLARFCWRINIVFHGVWIHLWSTLGT